MARKSHEKKAGRARPLRRRAEAQTPAAATSRGRRYARGEPRFCAVPPLWATASAQPRLNLPGRYLHPLRRGGRVPSNRRAVGRPPAGTPHGVEAAGECPRRPSRLRSTFPSSESGKRPSTCRLGGDRLERRFTIRGQRLQSSGSPSHAPCRRRSGPAPAPRSAPRQQQRPQSAGRGRGAARAGSTAGSRCRARRGRPVPWRPWSTSATGWGPRARARRARPGSMIGSGPNRARGGDPTRPRS